MEQLSGSIESAAISIGSALAPAIRVVAEGLTLLVNIFNSLPPPVQQGIAVTGALTAGFLLIVGPILMLVGSLPAISAGLISMAGAVRVVSGALMALTVNPIGAVIAAVGLLIAAGVALYQNWDTVKRKISGIWEGIKTVFSTAGNSVLNFLKNWGPLILIAVTGPVGLIVSVVAKHWDSIKDITTQTWNNIKVFVVSAFKWLYDHNYYFQHLVDAVSKAWNNLKTSTEEVWNAITGWLSDKWNSISETASEIWNGIASTLSGIWDSISNTIQSGLSPIK